jgi:hypothetical protein
MDLDATGERRAHPQVFHGFLTTLERAFDRPCPRA